MDSCCCCSETSSDVDDDDADADASPWLCAGDIVRLGSPPRAYYCYRVPRVGHRRVTDSSTEGARTRNPGPLRSSEDGDASLIDPVLLDALILRLGRALLRRAPDGKTYRNHGRADL